MSLTPNQQLFEYRIKRILGRGAFGAVYLAHDTLLDRSVAVEELIVTAQTDEMAFKRFLQEARAAGGLNSPHIVTVHALKVVGPEVYLVTEYLAGGSLRALLEERGRLSLEEAVRIAADVCDGLAAAHARGIVHRDIKPENVLLTEEGRAKVGDFGIAHVPRGAGGTSLTQAGFQPGTLLYMSPEQIRGQTVDGRSDVYQAGALLYEMLAGRHYVDFPALERQARETAGSNVMLFQARLYELLAEVICEREPADVCRLRPDVPEWVGKVVAAALARRIEERPTATDLVQTLQDKQAVWILSAEPATPLSEFLDRVGGIPEDNRDPRFAEINEKLRTLFSRMTIKQICYELEREIAKRPNGRAYKLLGFAYFNAERIDDAIRLLKLSLTCTIEDPVSIYENLGNCYVLKEDWANAERWFARSDRYDFPYLLHTFGRDFIYVLALGKQKRGMPVFGHLSDSEFVKQQEQLLALSVKVQLEQATPKQVRVAASELRQSFHSDTLSGVATPIRLTIPYDRGPKIESDSTNSHLAKEHFNLGVVYWQQGRLDEAIREWQAALRVNPNFEAHYVLGLAYSKQDRLDDAIREFEAALRINTDDADVHFNLGLAYGMQGRTEGAIREFEATLRLKPDHAYAHYNLGLDYRKQGRPDDAVREFQAVLRINSNYAEAHYNLGLAYGQQSRWDEAIREFQAALRINSNYAEAHYILGLAYGQQGRLDEAIHELQAALRINPDDAEAHFNLGAAYRQQGRLDEAVREFQAALHINPNYAEAHVSLGLAYAQQSRLDKAIREFQVALHINPNDAVAHHYLGMAYGQQRRWDEAIHETQLAARLGYQPAQEMLVQIGLL